MHTDLRLRHLSTSTLLVFPASVVVKVAVEFESAFPQSAECSADVPSPRGGEEPNKKEVSTKFRWPKKIWAKSKSIDSQLRRSRRESTRDLAKALAAEMRCISRSTQRPRSRSSGEGDNTQKRTKQVVGVRGVSQLSVHCFTAKQPFFEACCALVSQLYLSL